MNCLKVFPFLILLSSLAMAQVGSDVLIKGGVYKSQSTDCPSLIIKKNGKFIFTKTSKFKKQKGSWEISGETLTFRYTYEVYKENKGKKYTTFDQPAYQVINDSIQFQIIENKLIVNPIDNRHNKVNYGSYKYFGCYEYETIDN